MMNEQIMIGGSENWNNMRVRKQQTSLDAETKCEEQIPPLCVLSCYQA